jgi:hypothetical protein
MAEPSVTTRINPSVSSKIIIGASHHFLRTRKKLQNSLRIENFPFILELVFVAFRCRPCRSWLPVNTSSAIKSNFNRALSCNPLQQLFSDKRIAAMGWATTLPSGPSRTGTWAGQFARQCLYGKIRRVLEKIR